LDGSDVLAAVVFPASLLLCFVALLVNSVDSRRSKTNHTMHWRRKTQQYATNERNNGSFWQRRFCFYGVRMIAASFCCLACQQR
jgi:hypothetical protein